MPKSRSSRSSSSSRRSSSSHRSSSSRKKTTMGVTKEIKIVPMPPQHIKRLVDDTKEAYELFDVKFVVQDKLTDLLESLRYIKPKNPNTFWKKMYIWQHAVENAIPSSKIPSSNN